MKTTHGSAAKTNREYHFLLTPFLLTLPVVLILFVLIWGSDTAGSSNADAFPEHTPAVQPTVNMHDTLKGDPLLR